MLTVARGPGERLAIGPVENPIGYIAIREIRKGHAVVDIDCPGLEVNREEYAKKLARENTLAKRAS